MAASVWRKSSYWLTFRLRPLALTMPAVTDPVRPNGAPKASTRSPISMLSLSPSSRKGSGSMASMLTTAGSTFLTTSRYEVSSRGKTTAGWGWPFRYELVIAVPRQTPRNRTATSTDHLFMVELLPRRERATSGDVAVLVLGMTQP